MNSLNTKKEDLLSTQKAALRKLNKAIESILLKYNADWVNNEHDIDQESMSEFDSDLYSNLFNARSLLQDIQGHVIRL